MKILLDTHILIWLHQNDKRLSQKARKIILNPQNDIFYSSINIWEAQLKHLKYPDSFQFSGEHLDKLSLKANLSCLYVKPNHVTALGTLTYSKKAPKIHNDPFDRMLICQAKVENMFLMIH
ncbi:MULTISPECIES: type II toxin-antitoxin system VapC family toxin [unclassified Treponema]|uniref:type II toxin-antitoxin system VapC family toxin n=1 Tax=unclassified Treponema TaxID=2638727 RepID=UPI0020A49B77|nr:MULTISPECIES: type II toxin-antitoxin system VapC family toxin [unclassified Treponema]